MSDEIKELFNNFKEHLEKNYQFYLDGAVDSTEYYMSCGDLKLLLDFITNLQEENKELNDDNIWWNNRFKAVERDNRDYKSRIDKAIEYIENNKLCICKEDEGMIFTSFVDKELLEILKGDSSNE